MADDDALSEIHRASQEYEATALTMAEVLVLVGTDWQDWVRRIAKGQLRNALAFSSVDSGSLMDEERARAASARLLVVHDEAAQAFPFEDWYSLVPPDETTLASLGAQRPIMEVARGADQKPPAWLSLAAAICVAAWHRRRTRSLLLFLRPTLRTLLADRSGARAVKDELVRQLENERSEHSEHTHAALM